MKNTPDLDPKKLLNQIKAVGVFIQRYLVIIAVVLVIGVYGFLVLQISSGTQKEPTEDEVTSQLSTIKRLKIDQDSIDKIQQLKSQNVTVQSLFESARNDPFQE